MKHINVKLNRRKKKKRNVCILFHSVQMRDKESDTEIEWQTLSCLINTNSFIIFLNDFVKDG